MSGCLSVCSVVIRSCCIYIHCIGIITELLARDAQALIVAQCLSIHLSICVSVRDSLSHAYVRSIARREPRQLPACCIIFALVNYDSVSIVISNFQSSFKSCAFCLLSRMTVDNLMTETNATIKLCVSCEGGDGLSLWS